MTYIEISIEIETLKKNQSFLIDMQSAYDRKTDEFKRYQACINIIQGRIDYLQYNADYEIVNPG